MTQKLAGRMIITSQDPLRKWRKLYSVETQDKHNGVHHAQF